MAIDRLTLLQNKTAEVAKAANTKVATFSGEELSLSLSQFRRQYPNASVDTESAFLAQQQEYLNQPRNQSMVADIATDIGISFGDRFPQTVGALTGMAADQLGLDTVSDAMWDYVGKQQAEAEESEKDYSHSLLASKQRILDAAAARKAEYMGDGEMTTGEAVADFFSTGVDYLSSPTALVSEAAQSAESLFTIAATGGFAGAGAKIATKQAIKTKMGKEALKRAGAKKLADKAAKKAAQRTGVAVTGITEGSSNAIQTRDEIMAIPQDVLETSDDFKTLQEKNPELSFEDARKKFANEGAFDTAVISGLIAAGVGKVSGASDAASTALVKGATKDGIAKTAAKGAVKELAEEVVQSGSGQLVGNIQVAEGDESKQVLEDVGSSAAAGGLAGGLIGGTVAGTGRTITKGAEAPKAIKDSLAQRKQAKAIKKAAEDSTGDPAIDAIVAEAVAASTVTAAGDSEQHINDLKESDDPKVQELAKTPQAAAKVTRKAALNLQAAKDAQVSKGESTEAIDRALANMNSISPEATQTAPKGNATAAIKKKEAEFNKAVAEKEHTPEEMDALLDDLIGDISFQIDPNDKIEPEALESLKTSAINAGASPERLKGIDRLIDITKSTKEVSNDIRVGNTEWAGAKQYLSKINTGLLNGADLFTANTYSELSKFNDEMQHKVQAYNIALKDSEASGKVEVPLRRDGTPYTQVDNHQAAWVKAGASEQVIKNIEADAKVVTNTMKTADAMIQSDWSSTDLSNTIADLGLAPTKVEATNVEPLLTEVGTEEAMALIDTVSASDEGWTQERVKQADNIIKTAPVKAEPVATDTAAEPEKTTAVATTAPVKGGMPAVINDALPIQVQNFFDVPSNTDTLSEGNAKKIASAAARMTNNLDVKDAIRYLGRYMAGLVTKEQLLNNPRHSPASIAAAEQLIRDGSIQVTTDTKSAGQKSIEETLDTPSNVVAGTEGKITPEAIQLARESMGGKNGVIATKVRDALGNIYVRMSAIGVGNNTDTFDTILAEEVAKLDTVSDAAFQDVMAQVTSQMVTEIPVPANFSEADKAFVNKNEFLEEGTVGNGTRLSNNPYASLASLTVDAEAQTFAKRVDALGAKFNAFANKRLQRNLSKLTDKNMAFHKQKGHFQQLLNVGAEGTLDSGVLHPLFSKAVLVSASSYIASASPFPTERQVKAFLGLANQSDAVPSQLYPKIMDDNGEMLIGDMQSLLVRELGNNAMATMDMTFSGEHANTRNRMRDTLGELTLSYLVASKVIEVITYDVGDVVVLNAHGAKMPEHAISTYRINKNNSMVAERLSETGLVGADTFLKEMAVVPFVRNPSLRYAPKSGSKVVGSIAAPSPKLTSAMDKLSKTPHYLNKRMSGWFDAMGEDFKIAAGYVPVVGEGEGLMEHTKNKILGKNLTINREFDLYQSFRDSFDEAGADAYGEAFYYPHIPLNINRITTDVNGFDYQSSKMHRFLSNLTPISMDITEEGNSEKELRFKVAVAQGLGISVDKRNPLSSVAEMEELLYDRPSLISDATAVNAGTSTAEQRANLAAFANGEENIHTLMALAEYAAYLTAVAESNTSFEVTLPVEWDGRNNGPITFLLASIAMKVGKGNITMEHVEKYLEKAGILDKSSAGSGTLIEEGLLEGLYEEAQATINTNLKSTAATLKGDPERRGEYIALRAQLYLKRLSKLVAKDEAGNYEVTRDETKPVVTESFYGAGDAALAASDVRSMLNGAYGALQKAYDGYATSGNLPATAQQHSWNHLVQTYSTVHQALSAASGVAFRVPEITPDTALEVLNADLYKKYYEDLYNNVYTPQVDDEVAGAPFKYSDIKLEAIRANNSSPVMSQFKSAYDVMEVARDAMTAAGLFSDTVRQQELAKARVSEKVSRFEEVSNTKLGEVNAEILKQIPTYSLNMHSDKVNYTDAIPAVKTEPVAMLSDRNRMGLTDVDKAPYTEARALAPVGSGAVPYLALPIADAAPFANSIDESPNVMSVFDGMLANALADLPPVNQKYLDSLRDNDVAEILYSGFMRAKSGIETVFDINTGEFSEDLTPTQIKHVLLQTQKVYNTAAKDYNKSRGLSPWKGGKPMYNQVDFAKKIGDMFHKVDGKTVFQHDPKFPITKLIAAHLRKQEAALVELTQAGNIGQAMAELHPEGAVIDQFSVLSTEPETYGIKTSSRLNAEPTAEFVPIEDIVEQKKGEPFWQEENSEYFAPATGYNPAEDAWFSEVNMNQVIKGKHTKTARGFQIKLNRLVDQTSIAKNKSLATFYKKVLNKNILAPALAKMAANDSLPEIVITDAAGLKETFKNASKGVQKDAQKSKGIAVTKNGKTTIYLNKSRGGISAETLFHELVHAALDNNITTLMRGNPSFKRLLKQMKDIATTELQENRIDPELATYNERELFAWGLTNLDVITSLASKEQREVALGKKTGWSGFVGALLNILKKTINYISGTKVHEDSVLSYLVDTAANLAGRNIKDVESINEHVSFQMEAEGTFKQAPEDTFSNLLQSSTASRAHKAHLQELFYSEILAVQDSKDTTLSEYAKNAVDALTELQNAGTYVGSSEVGTLFSLDATESYLYDNYRHIIGAGLDGMAPSSQAISNLYLQARKQIKAEDFLLAGEVATDPVAMSIAQQKWNAVFLGAKRTATATSAANVQGRRNRSDYMADFVALNKVSPEFRAVMQKRVLTSVRSTDDMAGIQAWVISHISKLVGFLSDTGTGTRLKTTYKSKIDKLAYNLTATEFRAKSRLENRARGLLGKGGEAYSLYSKTMDTAYKRILKSTVAKGIKHGTSKAFTLGKESIQGRHNAAQAKRYREVEQSMIHGAASWVPEVIEDVSNTHDGNKYIDRLFYKKNKVVAGGRDGKIKATKDVISDWLGKTLSNKFVSKGITEAIISADITSLTNSYSVDGIAELYADSALLQTAIDTQRSKLGKSPAGNMLNRSATSLGFFMVHGVGSEAITFPNADVIIQRIGEASKKDLSSVRDTVDELASLVAMQQTSEESKQAFITAFKDNPEGITSAINLQQQYNMYDLHENLQGDVMGRLKGRTDIMRDPAKDVRIVTEEDAQELYKDGYRLHRAMETVDGPMVIIYSDTNGQGTFTQGAMSTVIGNQQGFKNLDGRSLSGGYDDYSQMQRKLPRVTATYKNYLKAMGGTKLTHKVNTKGMLATHSQGSAITLESVVPRKELDVLLGADARFEQVLPHMFGRTAEISHTGPYNEEVNKALVATYNYDKERGSLKSYIEISASAPTKRGREAYRMMPPAARAHMKEIWGDKIFIKSALFTKVYGYRKASLANVLKQNSDSPKWAQQLMRQTLGLFFTDKAMIRAISTGEMMISEAVGYIKDWIVVRGIKVLIDNVISNTVELVLINDGMTVAKAIKYQVEGMRLAKRYQEDEARLRRISVDILGKTGAERQRLIDESLQLQEELSKNNAKTLIDMGFMSAIVEDVGSDDNLFSYGNKLGTAVDSKLNKLPESVRWVAGNLTASRDSEWYKTAYKFTQLSDFSSRYAMFKNAQEQGKVDAAKMDDIADAFVNYDLPSNKYIQYLGDMGLVWFLKYFMRIQKVIIKGTVANPRKAAEFAAAGTISGVDVASYFDAFFLVNSITNKFGPINYTEKGIESLPAVQLMDML